MRVSSSFSSSVITLRQPPMRESYACAPRCVLPGRLVLRQGNSRTAEKPPASEDRRNGGESYALTATILGDGRSLVRGERPCQAAGAERDDGPGRFDGKRLLRRSALCPRRGDLQKGRTVGRFADLGQRRGDHHGRRGRCGR